jgi:TfdA family taurine catabolism dioxygenase TauD
MAIEAQHVSQQTRRRSVPVLDAHIDGAKAWTGETLQQEEWMLSIPAPVLAEVEDMLAAMRRDPLPALQQDPSYYRLAQSTAFFGKVRDLMDNGAGFVLIDRLPVEDMSEDEARAVYWVVSKLIGRPVAQKWNGTMMMDVRDSGQKPIAGSGVRLSQTSVDLAYHSDNAHNDAPAEYVGLLMLQDAKIGGVSKVMSFYTVHNYLRSHHREQLPRLYKPFFWDRMREHHPAESPLFSAPIFKYHSGQLEARLGLIQIRNAYAMIDGGMDEATSDALDAIGDAFSQSENAVEMTFRPGQIQFLNNRMIGHARTEFFDHEEAGRKRHLLRIWLRDSGLPNYRGTI